MPPLRHGLARPARHHICMTGSKSLQSAQHANLSQQQALFGGRRRRRHEASERTPSVLQVSCKNHPKARRRWKHLASERPLGLARNLPESKNHAKAGSHPKAGHRRKPLALERTLASECAKSGLVLQWEEGNALYEQVIASPKWGHAVIQSPASLQATITL